jgi:hypothetical protein
MSWRAQSRSKDAKKNSQCRSRNGQKTKTGVMASPGILATSSWQLAASSTDDLGQKADLGPWYRDRPCAGTEHRFGGSSWPVRPKKPKAEKGSHSPCLVGG